MVLGFASDRRLAERWAGHSPRAPQVLAEESIERLASYILWAGVQYEQQHGATGGDVRDPGHDRRSPALYEVVEEGVDQHHVARLRTSRNRVEHLVPVVTVLDASIGFNALRWKLLMEHFQSALSLPSSSATANIAAEHPNVAAAGHSRRVPGEETATEVAVVLDVDLGGPQGTTVQGSYTSRYLRHGRRVWFTAERVHEAKTHAQLALPSDQLGENSVLEEVARVSHIVRKVSSSRHQVRLRWRAQRKASMNSETRTVAYRLSPRKPAQSRTASWCVAEAECELAEESGDR